MTHHFNGTVSIGEQHFFQSTNWTTVWFVQQQQQQQWPLKPLSGKCWQSISQTESNQVTIFQKHYAETLLFTVVHCQLCPLSLYWALLRLLVSSSFPLQSVSQSVSQSPRQTVFTFLVCGGDNLLHRLVAPFKLTLKFVIVLWHTHTHTHTA